MSVVNIFLTAPDAESYEPFEHGGQSFRFNPITVEGPVKLIEGPTWYFIDWILDDISGLEMCRRLRADPRTSSAHITVILEVSDAEDQRRALQAGADDYALGPVDRNTILDRVLAQQLPQIQLEPDQKIECGSLLVDLPGIRARWNGIPLEISLNEFRLLRFFAENANVVLSRKQVIEGLGKVSHPIDERTVDVSVSRLRRALKKAGAPNILRTVRARGYVLDT